MIIGIRSLRNTLRYYSFHTFIVLIEKSYWILNEKKAKSPTSPNNKVCNSSDPSPKVKQ